MKTRGRNKVPVSLLRKDEELKKLGDRIKSLRIQKGYSSYEQFAFEHEISRAQYGRYEQGQDLRFSSFLLVLNALQVSYQEFFSEGF